MPSARRSLPLCTAALAAVSAAQAPTFRELTQLTGAYAAVHDPLRQRTWFAMSGSPARQFEWDGATLRARQGDLDAILRIKAYGFDANAGNVVALGFNLQSQLVYGTHDGCRWQWQATPQFLTIYNSDPITYDQARRRFVIFQFQTNQTSRVVEFDGTTWTTTVTPQPTWRASPAFAYDPQQNHCVLWGGLDSQGMRNDTWRWDGTTFLQLNTNQGPGPRTGATFAYSSTHGGLVLYGDTQQTQLDTWLLVGANWTRLPTTTDAGLMGQPVLVDDGLGICAVGRESSFFTSGSRLAGNHWTLADGLTSTAARTNGLFAFDRRRNELVAFGGTLTPFEALQVFDGRWRQRAPTVMPPQRGGAVFAWSEVNQAVLLHGGNDQVGVTLNDTWLWDGAAWQPLAPPTLPPPRLFGAFAGDPSGGILLYGGFDGTVRSDHWLWNGGTWQQVAANGAPGPVFGALAALDEARQVTVVLGTFVGPTQQTWEWNGTAWQLRNTGGHPGLATGTRVAFDPGTGQVVALNPGLLAWNGSTWQSLPFAGPPGSGRVMLTDPHRGGLLLVSESLPIQVTTLTTQPAQSLVVGSGCATGTAPALGTLGMPALGQPDFALDLGSRVPGAPWAVWFGVGGPGALGPCAIVTGPTLGIAFGLTGPGGNAQLPLPIPSDRALLGLALLSQGAVFDAPQSPIGTLTLTAGLSLAIGW